MLVRLVALVALLATPASAAATEWFVQPGGAGNGTRTAPFGRIQDAIDAALPGDIVSVLRGTYTESLQTMRNGAADKRIVIRAVEGRGSVVVTAARTVLTVRHAYHDVDGLVIDAQYAAADAVNVQTAGHYLVLRRAEVRRTSKDAIDMAAPEGVLIENSLIHHALNAAGGRTDAHGIVAGAVRRLTIRGTEIHTFSGDAIQVDPARASPGWSDVTIVGCRLWLRPLPAAENGFAAGVVPGENAVDTKASGTVPRARLVIRDTVAFGFSHGLISNMAAFNLKENIDATIDGVTVYDSEIAFRVRGGAADRAGALVGVRNAVVYATATAFRYEEALDNFRVWNTTIGAGVSRAFRAASATATAMDVRNLLVLGSILPPEASHPSNLLASAGWFTSVSAQNYTLAKGAPAIDAGVRLTDVGSDRQGTARPQGSAWDVGAYEFAAAPSGADGEVVLYAASASAIAGVWQLELDATAAAGVRLRHPNAADPTVKQPLALPVDFFEITFDAEAGRPYRLWVRGRAQGDRAGNDEVYVQFSGSADENGAAVYRTGTTSAASVILSECSTCTLSGWGWQDNGSGPNVLGPPVYFAVSGPQTLRVQTRQDGFAIDQMVLSPVRFLTQSPGAPIDDVVILGEARSD